MPLNLPNLDDRSFEQLRDEALEQIRKNLNTDWSDLTPGDPGVVLLEVFAYLTEQMIYRLNRLPEKVYVALLRLVGISLYPPVAAAVKLEFTNATDADIVVKAGTRVTTGTGGGSDEPPVFTTVKEITVKASVPAERAEEAQDSDTSPAQGSKATVWARHCDYVRDEMLGISTGAYGQTFTVKFPPIVAATRDDLDLRLQTVEGESRIDWEEVPHFSHQSPESRVFVVDRLTGTIYFAPAAQMTEQSQLDETIKALAAVPPKDAAIIVSYPRGGGSDGNVAPQTLTRLIPAITGLTVTNPGPATGGQVAETLSNALIRGPQEIFSLERTITAQDFERLAESPGQGIVRARAFTQAARWKHGKRGTVEIRLVPEATESDKSVEAVTEAKRQAGEADREIKNLRTTLEDSQPLGTEVVLKWTNYKKVWVEATIDVKARESEADAAARIKQALHALINPLGNRQDPQLGWPFGQPLQISDVYRVILDDPAVKQVTGLSLCVETAPNREVRAIAADEHQPHTWYAGSAGTLFRSFNDGQGWEVAPAFPTLTDQAGERPIVLIQPVPADQPPGLVAVWVHQTDGNGQLSSIPFLSTDCGESWHELTRFGGQVEDMAWLSRETTPMMLLATDTGLYKFELSLRPGQKPSGNYSKIMAMSQPLYAVVVIKKGTQRYVAVARKSRGGVYLTNALFLAYDIDLNWHNIEADRPDTVETTANKLFQPLRGLEGKDIRCLAVQYDPRRDRAFLWAGAMAVGWGSSVTTPGKSDYGPGAFRWEITTSQPLQGKWSAFQDRWMGGSCHAIAFAGTTVLAASQWGGVLRLETDQEKPAWRQTSSVTLPRREDDVQKDFKPLFAIAANQNREQPLAMVGGVTHHDKDQTLTKSLYRTDDRGETFTNMSRTRFADSVSLPDDWLFISGDHKITTSNSEEGSADAEA